MVTPAEPQIPGPSESLFANEVPEILSDYNRELELGADPTSAPLPTPTPIATQPPVEPTPAPAQPTITPHQAARIYEQMEQAQYGRQIEDDAKQYQAGLEQRGEYSPEDIKAAVGQRVNENQRLLQYWNNSQQQQQFADGQFRAALHYGKKYGVDPETLLKYNSPEEMEKSAGGFSEVSKLRAENKRLKESLAPEQPFAQAEATPVAAQSRSRYLDDFNNGRIRPRTDAEWAKHDQILNQR